MGTIVTMDSRKNCLCSERERDRGDREVWEAADGHTIGVKDNSQGLKVKFAFDTVFNAASSNKQVCAYHSPVVHFGQLSLCFGK